jgi:hypothetical protein
MNTCGRMAAVEFAMMLRESIELGRIVTVDV